MRWGRTTACERAAQWISLGLDDELNGLERAALARHLGRCASCRRVKAELTAFTGVLRASPLVDIPRPVVVAGRRRARVRAVRWAGAGALASAVAVGAALTVFPHSSSPAAASRLSFRSVKEQRAFAPGPHPLRADRLPHSIGFVGSPVHVARPPIDFCPFRRAAARVRHALDTSDLRGDSWPITAAARTSAS